jgi:hypothetical protein
VYTRTSIHSKLKLCHDDNDSLPLPDEIIIVTDASIHKEKAAIAWIVTTKTGKVIKTCQHLLEESHILSFRAEAFGVFSALISLHLHIQQQHTRWTLYCDNKALIYRLNALKSSPVNIEWMDSDALLAICKITPENGQFCHVKGHTVLSDKSSLPERLNHIVDRKANDAIHDPSQQIQFNGDIKIFGAASQLISVQDIVHYCQMTVSKQYWQTQLGQTTFDLVDWDVYQ